jgi:predicted RNase H-like HicB family nuclease
VTEQSGGARASTREGVALLPSLNKRRFSFRRELDKKMKIKVVVHEAEEGGFWAEVPAIPGCATQGESFEELLQNLYEAIEGCLSVDVEEPKTGGTPRVLEISV